MPVITADFAAIEMSVSILRMLHCAIPPGACVEDENVSTWNFDGSVQNT